MEISGLVVSQDEPESGVQPGEWVESKGGIFIGEFDFVNIYSSRLGIRTAWYDAAIELGRLKTFNDTAKAVANNNMNGRGGLELDVEHYQAELFEKLRTGEAMDKHVIGPLNVVRAISGLSHKGEYQRRSDGNLPGKLVTVASGTDLAHWQWTCTPDSNPPGYVRVVDFTDGYDSWYSSPTGRLNGRACFAELVYA